MEPAGERAGETSLWKRDPEFRRTAFAAGLRTRTGLRSRSASCPSMPIAASALGAAFSTVEGTAAAGGVCGVCG